MKKNELKTGDIIVNRGGYLGVILMEQECVMYQTIGADELSEFNDDLTFADLDYSEGDIMEVHRGTTFLEIDQGELSGVIYQRNVEWERPTAEEIKENARLVEERRQNELEDL